MLNTQAPPSGSVVAARRMPSDESPLLIAVLKMDVMSKLSVLPTTRTSVRKLPTMPVETASKSDSSSIDFQKINFQWHIKNPQLFGKVEGHHTSYKHAQINRG